MADWIYKDKVVEEIPDGVEAFVYLITNNTNNKKYIGKKLTTRKACPRKAEKTNAELKWKATGVIIGAVLII